MVSTYKVKQNLDLLALIVVFVGLILITSPYPEVAKQYPMVFLVAGLVVVTVQFLVEVALPPEYSRYFRALTEGLASEFDTDELIEDDEEEGDQDVGEPDTKTLDAYYKPLLITLGTIVGFWALSYYIGFLYSVPFYVFGTFLVLGNRDWKNALVVTAVLVVCVYFLFGELIHVPVSDGVLL